MSATPVVRTIDDGDGNHVSVQYTINMTTLPPSFSNE